MAKVMEGKLNAKGFRFGIVVSRFNDFINEHLLSGALDFLNRNGAEDGDIEICKVPGSFEIPQAARKMVLSEKYDAIICLGTVIRGATPHWEFIAAEVSKGIAMIGLESEIPITFGVLTTDNLEQAIERAGTKVGNKGWDAALSAVEMANLYREMKGKK